MARLIRTEKEVEGRFEEVARRRGGSPAAVARGPAVGRRPAALRKDGLERVRGEARYTADIRLPGMLHTAVLRCPHGHARVRRIDLGPALALPGVRAAVGPGDVKGFELEAGYAGAPVAAVAADTFGQARAAVHAIAVEWELLEVVVDPDEAVERGLLLGEPERHERGEFERALAAADVVVEGTYRTSVVLHNSMETHQSVCEWSARLSTSTPRRSTSGASATRWRTSSASPATRCASSASTWAAASARRTIPATTRSPRRSSRGVPDARFAAR